MDQGSPSGRITGFHEQVPTAQKPLGHLPGAEVNRVSELLLPGGAGWDVERVKNTFFEVDAEDILKIPVGYALVLEQRIISHGTTPKTGFSVSTRRIISRLNSRNSRQAGRVRHQPMRTIRGGWFSGRRMYPTRLKFMFGGWQRMDLRWDKSCTDGRSSWVLSV